VLEATARGLRSGASLRQALEEAAATTNGALTGDLALVAAGLRQGRPVAEVLDGWAQSRPLPPVRLAVAALALGSETGGAQARAVDGVAATIRAGLAVAGEVRALSSQARLSGLVIALAPLGFAGLSAAVDERTASFLFGSPVGIACLAVGLLLDGVAMVWMNRLCSVDL